MQDRSRHDHASAAARTAGASATSDALPSPPAARAAPRPADSIPLELPDDLAPDQVPLLQALVRHLAEGLVVVDPRGLPVLLNDAANRLFGPEALHTPIDDWPLAFGLFQSDGETPCAAETLPWRRALAGRAVSDAELYVRNDRVPRGLRLSVNARPLVDESGRVTGAAAILRDLSRQRRVERALIEERQLLERQSRRESALADIELAVNTPTELQHVFEQVVRLTTRHLPCDEACVVRWLESSQQVRLESSTLAGLDPPVTGEPPRSDGGATRWIVERRQALTVSDMRDDPFRVADLFPHEPLRSYAAVPLFDEDRAVGALFALDRAGRRYSQEDQDFLAALARRASTAITRVRLYDRLRGLNEALRERTAELQENEQRFRTLADTAPVLIWMTGPDGAPIYFNRTWLRFTGRGLAEEIDADWSAGIHPEDREESRRRRAEAFASRERYTIEYRRRRADGTYRWLTDTGTPRLTPDGAFVGFIGSCTDITVRKEAEEQLERHREQLETEVTARTAELRSSHEKLRVADRLATIGTLTAGLGHDMNNLLFPIRCRLDAIDPDTVPDSLADSLQAFSQTVDFLQQLTDGLRLFARDPEDDGAAGANTHVAEWWSQVEPLLARTNSDRIRLECRIDDDLPAVRVAPHRLTQAVLNLVINAAEAMPDGGTVQVAATRGRAGTVRVSVADAGQGMTEEVRLRAFDPFFTTKKRTLSTGLGLSLVHGVVKSAGGAIDVQSQVGRGTTVSMTFPVATDETSNGAPARRRPTAVVSMSDPRRVAWVASCVEAAGFDLADLSDDAGADLCVLETVPSNLARALRFLGGGAARRVIGIGAVPAGWPEARITYVTDDHDLPALRAAVEAAAANLSGGRP